MLELEHVLRPPLPWRDEELTECGRKLVGLTTITRSDLEAKVKAQGARRALMSTCMTCYETSSRWKDWDHSPSDVLRRELQFRPGYGQTSLDHELRAVAALIGTHLEEFHDILDGLNQTTSLFEVRRRRQRGMA